MFAESSICISTYCRYLHVMTKLAENKIVLMKPSEYLQKIFTVTALRTLWIERDNNWGIRFSSLNEAISMEIRKKKTPLFHSTLISTSPYIHLAVTYRKKWRGLNCYEYATSQREVPTHRYCRSGTPTGISIAVPCSTRLLMLPV